MTDTPEPAATAADRRTARRNVIATLIAVLVCALVGGSLAVYTDTDTPTTQVLRAGTVDIEVSDDDPNVAFDQPIDPMAAGDAWSRYLSVKNRGTLPIQPLSLSQVNGGGRLIDGDLGVDVSVSACTQTWTNGSCTGTEYAPALSAVQLRSWAGPVRLLVPGMAPGETLYFKFTTHLSADADNTYQDEGSWVRYTFDAIQRGPRTSGPGEEGTGVDKPTDPISAVALTATPEDSNRVALQWAAVPGAASYRAQRLPANATNGKATADDADWITLSIGPGLRVVDRFADPFTRYHYRVIATSVTGSTSASNIATATTWMDGTIPTLTAIDRSPSSVQLNWEAPTGVRSFTLEGGPGNDLTNSRVLYTGPATTFTHADLPTMSTYTYRVTAAGEGRSTTSTLTTTTTFAAPALHVTDAQPDRVALAWDSVPGATFTLRRKIGNLKPIVYFGADTAFTDHQVKAGTRVTYELDATRGGDRTTTRVLVVVPSELGSGEVAALRLALTDVTDTSAVASWTAVAGATGYHLEAAPTTNFDAADTSVVYSGTERLYRLADLAPRATTFYRVVALRADTGDSWTSEPVKLSTLMTPVQLQVARTEAGDRVALSWTGPLDDDVTYRVMHKLSNDTRFTTLGETANRTFLAQQLAVGAHDFKVLTVAPDGSSVESRPVTIMLSGLGQPRVTSTVALADAQVRLSWTAVAGASRYQVEYLRLSGATQSGTATPWRYAGAFSPSVDDAGVSTTLVSLPGSLRARVRVVAVSDLEQLPSEPVELLTSPTFKPPRATLSYRLDVDQFNWSWDAADSEDSTAAHYVVTYATAAAPDVETVLYAGSDRTTSFDPPSRTEVGRLRLSALDQHGQIAVLRSVPLDPVPQRPANVVVSPVSDTVFTIAWDGSASASSYAVGTGTYDPDKGKAPVFTELCATSGTSCTVTLSPGAAYPSAMLVALPRAGTRWSAPVPVAVAPVVGASVLSHTTTPTSVSVAWTSVTNAASYQLEKSATADFESPTVLYTGTALTHTDAGLTAGTTAYYRVVVRGANGTMKESATLQAGPGVARVLARSTAVSETSTVMSWDAVPGAARYALKSSAKPDMSGAATRYSGSALTFTDASLVANTRYYFTVDAFASDGTPVRATSSVVYVLTASPTPTITLTGTDWKTSAASFSTSLAKSQGLLERSSDGGATWVTERVLPSGATGATATVPDRGRSYLFRLSAVDLDGNKASAYVTTGPVLIQPDAPAVTLTSPNYARVEATWTAAAGATSYRVERLSSQEPRTVVATTTDLSVTDTTMASETSYTYYVTAVAASGAERQGSRTVAVQVKPAVMNAPVLVDSHTATLTWEPGGGANPTYTVYQSTSATVLGSSVATTKATSISLDTLVPGTTYYFSVITNSAGSTWQSTSNSVPLMVPFAGAQLAAVSKTPTSVDLTWNPVKATSHLVQYSLTPDFATPVTVAANLPGATTSRTVTSLTAGQRYYFRLTSSDATSTVYSDVVPVGTQFTAKPTPTVSSTTTTQNVSTVSAAWAAVAGATRYRAELRFEQRDAAEVQESVVTDTTSVTFARTHVGSALVRVTVTALNDAYSSSTALADVYTTPRWTPVSSVEFPSPDRMSVTFAERVETAIGMFRVAAYSDAALTQVGVQTTPSNGSLTAKLPATRSSSTYWVVTERRTGYSDPWIRTSDPMQVTSPRVAPQLRASKTGSTTTLSWPRVPGATGYRIFRTPQATVSVGVDGALNGSALYAGTDTSFVDLSTPTSPYSTYGVAYVLVVEGVPNTYPSMTALTDLSKSSAPQPTVTPEGPTSVRVSWTPTPGATSYGVVCTGPLPDAPSRLWFGSYQAAGGATSLVVTDDGYREGSCAMTVRTASGLAYSPSAMYIRGALAGS